MQKPHSIASPAGWYLLHKLLLACPYVWTYEGMMSSLFLPHNHWLASSLSKSRVFFSLDIFMTIQLSEDGHCIKSCWQSAIYLIFSRLMVCKLKHGAVSVEKQLQVAMLLTKLYFYYHGNSTMDQKSSFPRNYMISSTLDFE